MAKVIDDRGGILRIEATCPLCGWKVRVPFTATSRITFGANGSKGFLTVDCAAGGTEHDCKANEANLEDVDVLISARPETPIATTPHGQS